MYATNHRDSVIAISARVSATHFFFLFFANTSYPNTSEKKNLRGLPSSDKPIPYPPTSYPPNPYPPTHSARTQPHHPSPIPSPTHSTRQLKPSARDRVFDSIEYLYPIKTMVKSMALPASQTLCERRIWVYCQTRWDEARHRRHSVKILVPRQCFGLSTW